MEELLQKIVKIHLDCHMLCNLALHRYLPVAGNVGIFCQSEDEYVKFSRLQKEIIEFSDNPNQKYFLLTEPINLPASETTPQTAYTHLYIRKPDPSPYGRYLGDIDFVVEPKDYKDLKESVTSGEVKGAEMYDRHGWDTVQITDTNINSVAYISTKKFSEKVRVKFD